MDALIGFSGFVGSNLARQRQFDCSYNSKNFAAMSGRAFNLVVCAGIQAKKWWANHHAGEDWDGIAKLLDVLAKIEARRFVLISTVDVYPHPACVTETTPITGRNHPYGEHRFWAEEIVRTRFDDHYILRLPGLFGHGLKKNVIFDLLHDNCLEQINPQSVYQYYLLDHLWDDIRRCLDCQIRLLNVAAEPVPTSSIIDRFFPEQRPRVAPAQPFTVSYDMRTIYGPVWESPVPDYLYDRETVLGEIGDFVSREKSGAS